SIERARQLRETYPPPLALPASPMMHSTGLIMASLPVLTLGGTVISLTAPHFDADELFTAVARHRPSTVSIVGDAFARPMLRALGRQAAMGAPYDTSSLITITSAGVAWSGQVKEQLLEHIPQVTLVDACGSSEGAAIGSQVTRRGEPTSTDRFVPGAGLRLLRTDDSVIPADSREIGLFLLPTGCRGYRNDPERTARAFRTIDGQRYVLPGDWGRWNEDGTITLIGRRTSTINTGGEKVFPEEVQQVVLLNEDVEDCLVLGVPDERFGQRVAAIVQPVAGRTVDPDEVTRFVHDRLAGYKAPRTVLVATVPRGPNGKALFKEARAMFEDAAAAR
ncbi:MAG TPA: AMP-binding protein, partial [Trebonia sp.]|nr:AMP-binding protein [Trebonia sp.]